MLLQNDGLDIIGMPDSDWVSMGNGVGKALEEKTTDDNPKGLPQYMVDVDVQARDRRTGFAAIEQLARYIVGFANGRTPITIETNRFLMGHTPIFDEVVELENSYSERQGSIAKHVEAMIKKREWFTN